MGIKVGINGFGRIGRLVLKSVMDLNWPIEIVGVNSRANSKTMAHLLSYDSTHGRTNAQIDYTDDKLIIDGKEIPTYQCNDPKNIPWQQGKASIVIEATGAFRTREKVSSHLHAGIEKVVIAAPMKDADITIIMGVNHDQYDPAKHHIISNASCTSNCLTPICYILDKNFGIEYGDFSTIHSVTLSQRMLDGSHNDLRRARSAMKSIIPTTTGAVHTIGQVLPQLKGKINGISFRVPTVNVSLLDLVVKLKTATSKEELLQKYKDAATGRFKNIINLEDVPLVSTDFISNPHSAILDVELTQELSPDRYKIISWYDNEYGYARRIVDLTHLIGKTV